MGTRSLVVFKQAEKDLSKTHIVTVYQQFDGYPSGVGMQLAELIKDMEIINGISDQKIGEAANGIGCLAAQYVAKYKDDIGNIYITSEHKTPQELSWIDYVYEVIVDREGNLKVTLGEKEFTAKGFFAFCEKGGETEEEE